LSRSIVTDRVAVCLSVGRSVYRSVTLVSPAKTGEPIEMPVWFKDSDGPREQCIRWVSRSPWEGAILRETGASHCKLQGHAVICAKMAELIELPFGLWAQMGPRNRVRWSSNPIWEGAILEKRSSIVKYVSCAEMAEPIDLPFGLWTRSLETNANFRTICLRQLSVFLIVYSYYGRPME